MIAFFEATSQMIKEKSLDKLDFSKIYFSDFLEF